MSFRPNKLASDLINPPTFVVRLDGELVVGDGHRPVGRPPVVQLLRELLNLLLDHVRL